MEPASVEQVELPGEDLLPQELRGAVPREIPESVKDGPAEQRRRRAFSGCLSAGVCCLLIDFLPFKKTLAIYFLPLNYLGWIGIAICTIGLIVYVRAAEFKKACRYIREGSAGFGRVLAIAKAPATIVNGQVTAYALVVEVQVPHPDSGELKVLTLKSRDFTEHQKDRIDTRFRVGDAVPVVWLPEDFENTAQMYDFLEATPAACVRVDRSNQRPVYLAMLIVVSVFGFIFAMFWNLYAWGRYKPLDLDVRQGLPPFIAGGVLGLAITAVCYWAGVRRARRLTERNAKALAAGEAVELMLAPSRSSRILTFFVAPLGGVLLGGMTLFCWCATANAVFDRSAKKPVPVAITEMTQVTHSFVIRVYEIEFRREGDRKDHTFLSTPEQMSRFEAPIGIAQVRAGWLGWPWVESIEPAIVVEK